MIEDKKLKAMAEYLEDYLYTSLYLNAGAIMNGIKDFELAFAAAKTLFTENDKQYRTEQFRQVTTPHEKPQLRIYQPEGQIKTDWLDINENELQAIIELLT